MIRELKNSGLTITEISKRLGIDRKTARSAILKDKPPEYKRKESKTILDEFKPYIKSRLETIHFVLPGLVLFFKFLILCF